MIGEAKEIQSLALKYSKPQLAHMAQLGLIDTQKAVLAAMMRDRVAKEDAKPPTTTVAQDMLGMQPPQMAQAQPQQPQQPQQMGMPQAPAPESPVQMAATGGLTSIPVHMSDYAGGGIVAFDEGGHVPRYNGNTEDGSWVNYGLPFSGVSGGEEFFAKPTMPYGEQMSNVGSSIITGLRRLISDPNVDYDQKIAAAQKLKQIEKESAVPNMEITKQEGSQSFAMPDQFVDASSKNKLPPVGNKNASVEKLPPNTKRPAVGSQAVGNVGNLPPIMGAPNTKVTPYDVPTIPSIKDELGRLKEADKEAGVDTAIYDKLRGDLETKKGKIGERKQEAIGNALMQTGLGLMGAKQGREFEALGESGQKALAGLVSSNEKIREYEDRLEDKQRDLMMAENEYKRTNSKTALARIDRLTDKVDELKVKQVDAQNKRTEHEETIALGLSNQAVTARGQNLQYAGTMAHVNAAYGKQSDREKMGAEYNRILKEEGEAAAERYLQLQERLSGTKNAQHSIGSLADKAYDNIMALEKEDFSLKQLHSKDPAKRKAAIASEFQRLKDAYMGGSLGNNATVTPPQNTGMPKGWSVTTG